MYDSFNLGNNAKHMPQTRRAILEFLSQCFSDEIAALQKCNELERRSHVVRSEPALYDGVLRVGGTLHYSALSVGRAKSRTIACCLHAPSRAQGSRRNNTHYASGCFMHHLDL